MRVLSERATSLLAFLRSIPDSAACDACMAAHLGVDRYDVTVENPRGVSRGVSSIELDGVLLAGDLGLTLADDRKTHRVRIVLG